MTKVETTKENIEIANEFVTMKTMSLEILLADIASSLALLCDMFADELREVPKDDE